MDEPNARRLLSVATGVLLVGVALVGVGSADLGSVLVLAGLVGVPASIHFYGRQGPEEPEPAAPAEPARRVAKRRRIDHRGAP